MALEEKRTAGESSLVETFFGGNLVLRIAIGIAVGIVLAFAWPDAAKSAMLLGNLFVNALKAVAPVSCSTWSAHSAPHFSQSWSASLFRPP
jgi:Na+/serine symporter